MLLELILDTTLDGFNIGKDDTKDDAAIARDLLEVLKDKYLESMPLLVRAIAACIEPDNLFDENDTADATRRKVYLKVIQPLEDIFAGYDISVESFLSSFDASGKSLSLKYKYTDDLLESEEAEPTPDKQEEVERMQKDLAKFGLREHNIASIVEHNTPGENVTVDTTNSGSPPRTLPLPIYPKISRKDLDIEVLSYYDLPWAYASDSQVSHEYIIILTEMSLKQTDILFEHTRRLRTETPFSHELDGRKAVQRKKGWRKKDDLDVGLGKELITKKLQPQISSPTSSSSSSSLSSGVLLPPPLPRPTEQIHVLPATRPIPTYSVLCHLFEDGREEIGQTAEYFQSSSFEKS